MSQRSQTDMRPDSIAPSPAQRATAWLMMNAPELPEIIVTTRHAMRLDRLVGDCFHIRDQQIAFLARELERATIVDPADPPKGVVTMRSLVEFWSGEDGKLSQAMLVYPAEASVPENNHTRWHRFARPF